MRQFPGSVSELLERPFLTSPDWERFSVLLRDRIKGIEPGAAVLCAEADRVEALSVLFATVLQKGGVFLANPNWKEVEWETLTELAVFHKVFGVKSVNPDQSRAKRFDDARLMIPSGGTSGTLRFCVHSLDTLTAAVESLHRHHGRPALNSVGTLPVFHVSGLMPILRAMLTGGMVQLAEWKQLEAGNFPRQPGRPCFLSLVPTQLSRLIRNESGLQFLHSLDTIYLGGAGIPTSLVQFIRGEKLPVEFVYGMTETAAMVVYGTRGDSDETGVVWGQALPGVTLALGEEDEICVQTDSLFRGYFPEDKKQVDFRTGDVGRWVTPELVQVLGRKDFLINSGGEKVNPEEVEGCLATLLPGVGLAVGPRPDDQWGEVVVALLEHELSREQLRKISRQLSARLVPHKIPKEFITGAQIPRSELGKIDRAKLRRKLESTWK